MLENSLKPIFNPRGIVIIGASPVPNKLGYGIARNLVRSGFRGGIHFVNPKGGELFGQSIFLTIEAVPDPVDLAVLLVPASSVPEVLKSCGKRNIQAAIIASGGFRENGALGETLEKECLRIAQKYRMRLVGPNCIGLLDTHLPMNTTFLQPPGPPIGDIAFITHSGAMGAVVSDFARGNGFGVSKLVSLGNQVDVNETDVLEVIATDEYTKVVTLYLEGVGNGRKFVEVSSKVSKDKPIIALKVGKFDSGRKAASSHTGAMTGIEMAYNAAFRRAGILRPDTIEEMFDWARTLSWCKLPKGRSVAVLTNAGGPGVTAADALEKHGLKLAEISDETKRRLLDMLPMVASLDNPVDILASASPGLFADCLQTLLIDPRIDRAMVILPPPPMYSVAGVVNALVPVIHGTEKPVVVVVLGKSMVQEGVARLQTERIPEFRFPEPAASALSALSSRAEFLEQGLIEPLSNPDVQPKLVHKALKNNDREVNTWLSQDAVSEIISAYGIPYLEMELARNAKQAVAHANRIGFPVVLKVASSSTTHKSDIGGVALNLQDDKEVEEGFKKIVSNFSQSVVEPEINGVYVQPMVDEGQEVILGVIQDEQFGPMVMFGSGGVEVEGLQDVAFSLVSISLRDIEYLLNATWAGRKLEGYRNIPKVDRSALIDVMTRLAQLAHDFPSLKEIEINPLRVMDHGTVPLDVRIRYSKPLDSFS